MKVQSPEQGGGDLSLKHGKVSSDGISRWPMDPCCVSSYRKGQSWGW